MQSNKVSVFLKDFISCWQVGRIYEIGHPQFMESLSRAYDSLKAILSENEDLVLGIFGEELASGDEVFFDLSQKVSPIIKSLKSRGIEKISFKRGVNRQELAKLIYFLLTSKSESFDEFQEYLYIEGMRNISVGKIKAIDEAGGDSETEKKGKIQQYEKTLDRIAQILDEAVNKESINTLQLKFVTNGIMDSLVGNYQLFFKLLKVKSYDTITFTHLLNVSILSMYFSHKLGFNRQDCISIGVAALFHDIGKLYIAKKIVQKAGRLDEEEFSAIKNHAVLGAQILLKYVDSLTILPVVVAFEHHLRYDLGGYPKVFFPRRPHIASLIVHICDEYDALSQRRSYKQDYPPEKIYKLMNIYREKKFPSGLLDKFFRIMGVWPKGTIVRLDNGEVAIVREEDEEDMFSPKVEVVSGNTKGIVDLKTNQTIKIQSSLNPLGEGKEYIEFV